MRGGFWINVVHSLNSVADIAERHAFTPIYFQHLDEDGINLGGKQQKGGS